MTACLALASRPIPFPAPHRHPITISFGQCLPHISSFPAVYTSPSDQAPTPWTVCCTPFSCKKVFLCKAQASGQGHSMACCARWAGAPQGMQGMAGGCTVVPHGACQRTWHPRLPPSDSCHQASILCWRVLPFGQLLSHQQAQHLLCSKGAPAVRHVETVRRSRHGRRHRGRSDACACSQRQNVTARPRGIASGQCRPCRAARSAALRHQHCAGCATRRARRAGRLRKARRTWQVGLAHQRCQAKVVVVVCVGGGGGWGWGVGGWGGRAGGSGGLRKELGPRATGRHLSTASNRASQAQMATTWGARQRVAGQLRLLLSVAQQAGPQIQLRNVGQGHSSHHTLSCTLRAPHQNASSGAARRSPVAGGGSAGERPCRPAACLPVWLCAAVRDRAPKRLPPVSPAPAACPHTPAPFTPCQRWRGRRRRRPG